MYLLNFGSRPVISVNCSCTELGQLCTADAHSSTEVLRYIERKGCSSERTTVFISLDSTTSFVRIITLFERTTTVFKRIATLFE